MFCSFILASIFSKYFYYAIFKNLEFMANFVENAGSSFLHMEIVSKPFYGIRIILTVLKTPYWWISFRKCRFLLTTGYLSLIRAGMAPRSEFYSSFNWFGEVVWGFFSDILISIFPSVPHFSKTRLTARSARFNAKLVSRIFWPSFAKLALWFNGKLGQTSARAHAHTCTQIVLCHSWPLLSEL